MRFSRVQLVTGLLIIFLLVLIQLLSNAATNKKIEAYEVNQRRIQQDDCSFGLMRESFIIKFWRDEAQHERNLAEFWKENKNAKKLAAEESDIAADTREYVQQLDAANKQHIRSCDNLKKIAQPAS